MSDIRKNRSQNLTHEVVCYVCEAREPLATAEDHHIKPRAFGGDDSPANRKWLCASCHTRIHKVQGLIIKGAMGKANTLCRQIFPQPAPRGRLWHLSNAAAQAEREMKEQNLLHKTHQKVNLNLELDLWLAIKKQAKILKIPATELAAKLLEQAMEKHDVRNGPQEAPPVPSRRALPQQAQKKHRGWPVPTGGGRES